MTKTFRLFLLGILTAQSLALFLLEGFIPLPFLAPGAKLGLANLITVIAFDLLPAREVFFVLLLRVLLGACFGGGPTVFFYSFSGAMLSFLVMQTLWRHQQFSLPAISAAGGFFHNVAQLCIACWITHTPVLWLYLPILGPLGLGTGFLLGITASFTVKRLKKTTYFAS